MTKAILLWILSIGTLLICTTFRSDAALQGDSLFEKRGIVVSVVDRSELASLVDAGTFETEGYSEMVLNMAGIPSATVRKTGIVGAILVPDIPPFDTAFKQWGILPVVVELTAEIKAGEAHFIAKQKTFNVGFPRYRLLLYNTSDSTMTVAFFAYRTHR
jgi:hypothetical protein